MYRDATQCHRITIRQRINLKGYSCHEDLLCIFSRRYVSGRRALMRRTTAEDPAPRQHETRAMHQGKRNRNSDTENDQRIHESDQRKLNTGRAS